MILFPVVMIQLFHQAYRGAMTGGIFHMVSAVTCVLSGYCINAKQESNRTMSQS